VATVEGQRLSRAIPAAALASYHVVLNDEGNIALNTLRSMEVAIRMGSAKAAVEGAVVVALGSALAGEGKSTVSALFAMHLARSGARVLLVDYDFRRGGLTRRFQGARHVVQGDAEPSAAHEQQLTGFGRTMMFDPLTGLVFLPAPKRSEAGREISRVISDGTEKQIGTLRSCFDYIVLDLPPLFQLPQGRMLAREIDKFFFIVEWGKANTRILERSFAHFPEFAKLLVGSVMNKFNMNQSMGYDKLEYY